MRKVLCTAALLAIVATVVAAQAAVKCTGLVEKKPYCSKCDKVLAATDVKAKKCVKDETDIVLVDVCVKKTYSFSCHPAKEGAAPGKSWWGKPAVESVGESRVLYKCSTCGAKAAKKDDLKHTDDCKKKLVVHSCDSGAHP